MENKVSLVSANDFTKVFLYNDIEIYISRAYDEDSDKHFLVNSIKSIPSLNVHNIQYPILFESQVQRDDAFNMFDENIAKVHIEGIIVEITKRNDESKSL